MQPRPGSSSLPVGLIIGLVAAFTVGGVTTWWVSNSLNQKDSEVPATNTTIVPTHTPEIPVVKVAEKKVLVYWLDGDSQESQLVATPVLVQIKEDNPEKLLSTALETLLAGPQEAGQTTNIPSGTRLLSLAVKSDGIHLNLSGEFTSGGGSQSMVSRLKQLLYTATTLKPKAQVWLEVEGKLLEELGGEGVIVDQPITRQSFEENFPN